MATPSAASSSRAGNGTSSPTSAGAAKDTPVPYAFTAPPWRPPLQPNQDQLGATPLYAVPDLFPTRPSQPEDDMSQPIVRSGLVTKPLVTNESFSAHDMIHDRLANNELLPLLVSSIHEALSRRQQLTANAVAPSHFRPPTRVTLNDVKLANYVRDLADPQVPLHRLSRSVPHGFRGERLFEMLWTGGAPSQQPSTSSASSSFSPRVGITQFAPLPKRSVQIPRAVWFVRAIGLAESQSVRNKSSWSYSSEITSNLCSWLAKQLAELVSHQPATTNEPVLHAASPATPSPGYFQPRTPASTGPHRQSSLARTPSAAHQSSINLATPKDVCHVLQNEADEERWLSKWSYSLSLTRHLNAQQLLDRSSLYRWIVEALHSANLSQLLFVLQLIQETAHVLVQRHFLARPLLAAASVKLQQLEACPNPQAVADARDRLRLLICLVLERCPEAILSPRLWHEHQTTITPLVSHSPRPDLAHVLRSMRPRVSRLALASSELYSPQQPSASRSAPCASSYVAALDSFDNLGTDLVDIFNPLQVASDPSEQQSPVSLEERIETILTWACTSRRFGIYRQYLAASLLEKVKSGWATFDSPSGKPADTQNASQIKRRPRKRPKLTLDPILLKWLASVEAALLAAAKGRSLDARNATLATVEVRSVIILFGEIGRRGVFSYSKYLQRLIARGIANKAPSGASPSEGDQTTSTPSDSASPTSTMQPPTDSLHLRLLRSLPIYEVSSDVLPARRTAIYGARRKETWEQAVERRALRELHQTLPWLFQSTGAEAHKSVNGMSKDMREIADPESLRTALPHLWNASRFVRIRIFRVQLLPMAATRPSALTASRFCTLAILMTMGEDFESLLQLIVSLLMRPVQGDLAIVIYDSLVQHHRIWRALDALPTLSQLIRQQLDHASSRRDSHHAVLASNALHRLQRLQTFAEPSTPAIRPPNGTCGKASATGDAGPMAEHGDIVALMDTDARSNMHHLGEAISDTTALGPLNPAELQRCQEAFRKLGYGQLTTQEAEASLLADLRQSFMRSDASGDETIEHAIVECMLEPGAEQLVDPAARLLSQLHSEASSETDERQARWLGSLAAKMAADDTAPSLSLLDAPLRLLTKLILQGISNLAIVIRHLLLPLVSKFVKTIVEPSDQRPELVTPVLRCTDMVSSLLLLEEVRLDMSGPSIVQIQSLRAQQAMLLSPSNFGSFVKLISMFTIAAGGTAQSSNNANQPTEASGEVNGDETGLAPVRILCEKVLRSEQIKAAFYSDPRTVFQAARETIKSVWGCNAKEVLDRIISSLDPNTLLLYDAGNIDVPTVLARADPWNASVLTCELVYVFERLQAAEPSSQTRAESKARALVAGLYGKMFLDNPSLGISILRDAQSPLLSSRFLDVGLKLMLKAVRGDGVLGLEKGKDAEKHKLEGDSIEPERVFSSLLGIMSVFKTFTLSATDSDTAAQLFQTVATDLELAATEAGTRDLARAQQVLPKLSLLYFVLRLNCLWSSAVAKTAASRLLTAILELCQLFGTRTETEGEFTLLLDTFGFVVDEMPPTVLGGLAVDLDWQMENMTMLPWERSEQVQRHLFNLNSMQPMRHLVVGAGVQAACEKGQFAPDAPKPWECLEYVDPPASSSALARSSAAGGMPGASTRQAEVGTGARAGWPSKLANSGSLSLSLFGTEVTREPIPSFESEMLGSGSGATPPARLESERSYGEYVAGEPIYARDLRRGKLDGRPRQLPVTIDLTLDDEEEEAKIGKKRKESGSTDEGNGANKRAKPSGLE